MSAAQVKPLPPAEEARAFLAANPDVEAVQIFITDPGGVPRGKSIARTEIEALFAAGRNVAGSIVGLDITGADVDATGLVWDVGDADKLCRPVAGTLQRAAWLERPTAQLMLTMYELDGRPAAADPRHALVRAVERFAALGYTPVMACEIEFYLVRDRDGKGVEPVYRLAAGGRQKIDSYSLDRLDELKALFDDLFAAAKAQGLPAETLMSEYAPGQFEITLHHRSDALKAVDEAILFKRLVKGVASKHGVTATFMAKPFAGHAGSGLHLHLSLEDAAGRNAFADAAPEGSALLRHAVGGMRKTMAESVAIFAPNGNSYRRFRPSSYAPIAPTWGVNNRSVSLRVPAGPPASRHIEHRVAGADANLYLAAATVLGAARLGIEGKFDPGPPIVGNGYTRADRSSLPATWHEAIERAAASEFLADALGADFLKVFLAIKRQECDRFGAEVTDLDYDWYLRTT
ncbi:MAG TPA: glutamine synthetase family protein [Steroidobacteraceae bacterium]|nr:glutamine synthetase family protein [Steroidobacteraceae bacterium]